MIGTSDIELADLHPLVIARIVCEWARIDRTFPQRLWGSEYLGTHVTLGLDRWYVGRDDKQAEPILQVTRHIGAYGVDEGQVTWRCPFSDLKEKGCRAVLRRA